MKERRIQNKEKFELERRVYQQELNEKVENIKERDNIRKDKRLKQ